MPFSPAETHVLSLLDSAATVEVAADDPYINLILSLKSRTFPSFENFNSLT